MKSISCLRENSFWLQGALGLVLATLLFGCAKSPEELLASARTLHAKGQLNGAVLELKSLLQEKPNHGESRLYLGELYSEMGDYRSAEKELRRAREAGIATERILPLLTKALVFQGEPRRALQETLVEGIQDQAAAAQVNAMHGLAHLALRDTVKAEMSFQESLALDPNNIDASLGRSRLFAAEKRLDEALNEVDIALAKHQRTDALMLRGDLLRALSRIDEAKAAYEKAVEIQPTHVNALLALVAIDLSAGALGAATDRLDAARKAAPENLMVHYFQALIQFHQRDFDLARDSIGNVLKVAPNHLPSVLVGGAVEFALGSHELAQTRLKYVLERAPANMYARRLLIASYTRAGQMHKAMELLESILKQGTNDASVLALAGEIHMQLAKYDKARSYFEQARALAPKNPSMRTGLGLSHLAMGDVEAATAELQSASALQDTKHHADVLLIATHLQHRQYAQALKAAHVLENKQPNSALTYNLLAAAQIGVKEISAARRSLEKALALQPTYTPAAVNLANLDLQIGDKVAARKRLEDIIKSDRQHVPAYLALASMAPLIGASQEEVERWLEVARRESPAAMKPLLMLARFHFRAGRPKKALEVVEKALLEAPNNPEVLELAGQVQLAANERNRAFSTFSKWLSMQPQSAQAQYRFATAQLANGDRVGAILSLRKAIQHRPHHSQAQVMLAELELRSGRPDESLKIAKQLQHQHPSSALGWVLEGDTAMATRSFSRAVKAYETAFEYQEAPSIIVKLHAALVKDGREGDAELRMRGWIRTTPEDIQAKLYLAEHYLKSARHREAVEVYESLEWKTPVNKVVLNNLAWSYLQIKDRRAVETAEKAFKLAPNDPAVIDTLGWILLQQQPSTRAVDLLRKAVELAPNSPEIRFHYVQGLHKTGQQVQAKEELESLLIEFPQFSEAVAAHALLRALRVDTASSLRWSR